MKKFLLLLLLIFSVVVIFSQTVPTPCPSDYKINNGGGNCPDIGGLSATGSVKLVFQEQLDPDHIPVIASVLDITDPNNPVPVTDVTFGAGELRNGDEVTYCYYVGPGNINNLAGHHLVFRFTVSYATSGGGSIICGEPFPLPVNFKSFTAMRNKNIVALKWTTASESNSLGFEIQRLIGGGSWQTVSFVYSLAPGGSSSSDISYTYSDLNSTKGVTQYRIRQLDIDQRSKYSEIRAVRGDGQSGKTIVFPNPVLSGGKINVVFEDANGTRDVSLIDLNGRQVRQWKAVTNNNLQIENLTPGFYNLKIIVRQTGEQTIEKIVVNKN
jgi:Secretion system C-terminal sorting domain